jgi:Na+:H+ antiporter, NhaA family
MMVGLGMVGGVGFTVSLFITGLSFPNNPAFAEEAKVGIVAGSVVAAVLGVAWLALVTRRASSTEPQPDRS